MIAAWTSKGISSAMVGHFKIDLSGIQFVKPEEKGVVIPSDLLHT